MSILSIEEKNRVFTRHRGPVTSVVQIPDSPWLVTSAYDGAVAKYNYITGEISLLGYHKHLVNRITIDRAGTLAASCSSDYSIGIWDIQEGKFIKNLIGHYDDVEDFIFAEENIGISASRDRRIIVWNLTTGAIIKILEGHSKDVLSLAYHDRKIYSTGDDKTLRVWSLDTGDLLNQWGPFDVETDTCAIDLIQHRVILGCDDGYVRIFDIEDGTMLHEIKAHSSGIKKVSCSFIDGSILSAAYDQRVRIWDAHTFEEKIELENFPSKWERSLVWSEDSTHIFAGTFDGTLLVWDAETGKFMNEIGIDETNGNACFNEIAEVSRGKVGSVSDDGYVRVVAIEDSHPVRVTSAAPTSGRFLMNAIAAHEKFLITGAHNQRVHYFNYEMDRLTHSKEVLIGEGPINSIRISSHPDYYHYSFIGCYSGAVVQLNISGEQVRKFYPHDGAVKALRLHPNSTVGVSCSANGEIISWDFDGNKKNSYLGHTAIINDLDISESGSRIATVSRDFTLRVYDFDTAQPIHTVSLGRKSLKSVSFYSDSIIVAGDYWGNLIVVSLETGDLNTINVAQNGISSVAKIGSHIAASSYDGAIYIFDPVSHSIIDTYREMIQKVKSEYRPLQDSRIELL
ncbi:WD40 repeat domain-containing protein [Paenibacillus sp. GCM10012307]|uniref:WD40 repeat domain-containing protein n=1 Tax=Paenibacillus roseus TaxID=2798579 RepID=A0A934MRB5_9BACL|nr:WD40 repeat domain-containing protein [Paenibacillus roseus]MBJ6362184.1 WD40 repeat domain-containing protein [Paenibacillus roseus]